MKFSRGVREVFVCTRIFRTVFYSSSIGSTAGISHHSQARLREETQENLLGFTFHTRWLLKTKKQNILTNPRNTCDLKNDYIIAYIFQTVENPERWGGEG